MATTAHSLSARSPLHLLPFQSTLYSTPFLSLPPFLPPNYTLCLIVVRTPSLWKFLAGSRSIKCLCVVILGMWAVWFVGERTQRSHNPQATEPPPPLPIAQYTSSTKMATQ